MRKEHHLPLPIIEYDGLNVVVTFLRTGKAIKTVANKALGKLTEAQLEGYEWLKTKQQASTREYSAHFDIGYKTAQRHLSRMRELKLIEDNGAEINSPHYKYIVK
jgi:predicted HTH transcriptional regulator